MDLLPVSVGIGLAVSLLFSELFGLAAGGMVVPGYVAQVHTEFTRTGDLLMPCHEFCGIGHSEMWATVQVLPEDQFKPGPDGRISCAQR